MSLKQKIVQTKYDKIDFRTLLIVSSVKIDGLLISTK